MFDTDKYFIRENYFSDLDNFISKIEGKSQIMIEGHTDNEGDITYNYQLSQKRCFAIQNYLLRNGISQNKIKIVSYGEAKPVSTNETKEGKSKNRRIEVVLTPKLDEISKLLNTN